MAHDKKVKGGSNGIFIYIAKRCKNAQEIKLL